MAITEYAPFPLTADPAEFGLQTEHRPSHLGSVRIISSPKRRGRQINLFLHGVGMCWDTWSPLLQAHAEAKGSTANWVFVDLPGFGGSEPLRGPITMEDVSTALRQALRLENYRDVTLVGHSMGGFLALDIAAHHETRAVASFSGAYYSIVDIVNAPIRSALASPAAWASYSGLRALARLGPLAGPAMHVGSRTGLLRLGLKDALYAPSKMQPSLFDALARGVRPSSFRHAEATGVGYDTIATWRRISAPVFGGFGDHDKMVGAADRRALERAQPTATIVNFARSGHFIPVEQPREAMAALNAWGNLA